MVDNEEVIREFIAAWSRLDPAELASFFAEDGVYHNIPASPIQGRQAIEGFIAAFIKPWTATEWDLIRIAASGNLVFAERLDRTRLGERKVDLPCCGVFELEAGKIKVWRDYFDMRTYMAGIGA
ncbi:MAG: SgcJ/EcaC family oxidoreductase [Phenylobacterium sp.]|jgi:limonene-1,2-epoxide hydrolase|uniref:SgcJ/EcaC family oxidoreductase n=1 Tax=Phenylobacterium sp. TaxID=1871053 RepID=UPI00391957BB